MGEEQMKQKLVVLVGGYYPYFGNPMGIVLDNLVDALVDKFDVTILAVKRNSAHTDSSQFFHKGAKVVTITSKMHDLLLQQNRFAKSWCRILSWVKFGRFEDYLIDMMFKAMVYVYENNPFDVIMSLGFPMQLHEAAMKFRNKYKNVKWITYSTDSCYGNSNLVSYRNAILKKVAVSRLIRREYVYRRNADHNFVSREIFNSTAESFQHVSDKSTILDYTILPKKQVESVVKNEVLHIVYAGGMPLKMRDPSYFLGILCALPNALKVQLDVYLIGAKPSALLEAERMFPQRVVVYDAVSHDEIDNIYNQRADVLLNLGNDSDVFSPSKLFDYVSTGLPIIDVYYKGRASNPVVSKHPMALRIENYGEKIDDFEALHEFLVRVRGLRLTTCQIKRIYSEYSPEEAVRKILEVL